MTKREIAVLSFKFLGLYAFIRVIDHLPYVLYMYTLQALWTQASEGLDVVTVISANRAYRILQGELRQMGIAEPSPRAAAMLDLGDPDLDWVKLAEGMGVP